jgi:glycosyltransferase involved in cell wall biosynthesis
MNNKRQSFYLPDEPCNIDLTYIVPVLNEEENIRRVHESIINAFAGTGLKNFEIIFVDDGSTDDTLSEIRLIVDSNKSTKCIALTRNYGHQAALSAGLFYSRGSYVAVLDGDLQDPPEVINDFYQYCKRGYDVVYGVRRKRKESLPKKISYYLYYRLLKSLSNLDIPLDSGDFCIMSRRAVNIINDLPEKNRFVRGLRTFIGLPQIGVEYERSARAAGDPKYSLRKLLRLASDGIFNFSDRPLKLASSFGGLIAISSIILGFLFVVQRAFNIEILGYSPAQVPGYTSIIVILSLLSGIQLYTLGILGEYISRIFLETKNRPQYIVRDMIGFEITRI